MFPKFAFTFGAILALATSACLGQTLTLDNTPPSYDPNTYRSTNDYVVGEVSFNNTTGPSSPYSTNPVGFKSTTFVTDSGAEIDVWDACAELFVGPTGASTYTLTPGLGASTWSSTQIDQIQALYSNALILFTDELSDYDTARPFGAAIQIALWEIAEETIGALDLNSGNFNIAGSDADAETLQAISLASQWITNIQDNTWTDQGGLIYYYADGGSEQSRLWVAVPEPSTALLGLLGMVCLMRRRR